MKNKVTVELKKGRVRWYYSVRHSNGKILVTSQKYFSRSNARRAAMVTAARLNSEVKEVS